MKKRTRVAVVSVDFGGALGDLEIVLVAHLVQGILGAREQFAGSAVAGRCALEAVLGEQGTEAERERRSRRGGTGDGAAV